MSSVGSTVPGGRFLFLSLDRKKNLKSEFERVALPQLPHLYTAAAYFTRDSREAEDLVQDTYLRAFRFFHKFEPGTNCRAWLLSILRNLFINRYRRKKQEPDTVDWEKIDRSYANLIAEGRESVGSNPERELFSSALDQEVEGALRSLPEEFRMAVTLVDIEELTYEEAAKVMECPIGTVRSRVSRGRRLLQVALAEYARKRGVI